MNGEYAVGRDDESERLGRALKDRETARDMWHMALALGVQAAQQQDAGGAMLDVLAAASGPTSSGSGTQASGRGV